jgi:hypothetical protein
LARKKDIGGIAVNAAARVMALSQPRIGDHSWHGLLDEHDRIARKMVEKYRGQTKSSMSASLAAGYAIAISRSAEQTIFSPQAVS